MAKKIKKKYSIDAFLRTTPAGSVNSSLFKSLNGMRITNRLLTVGSAREHSGFVFMTRPQLNFSTHNLLADRRFFSLLNNNRISIAGWIRGVLDPRWAAIGDYSSTPRGRNTLVKKTSGSTVDPLQPFITAVTNTVVGVSGFPNIDIPHYTSAPGRVRQTYSQVDGVDNLHQPIELTITAREVVGRPLYHMFRLLGLYSTLVSQGDLVPYPDFIMMNAKDYNIRVFRILTEPNGRRLSGIASTYPGSVMGIEAGTDYDYALDKPTFGGGDKAYRIQFSGAIYEDPILIDHFNRITMDVNPNMRGDKPGMVEIDYSKRELFTYERVYPFINTDTMTLDWWIKKSEYKAIMADAAFIEKNI